MKMIDVLYGKLDIRGKLYLYSEEESIGEYWTWEFNPYDTSYESQIVMATDFESEAAAKRNFFETVGRPVED